MERKHKQMALFTPTLSTRIHLSFGILLTCFAIQSQSNSIQEEKFIPPSSISFPSPSSSSLSNALSPSPSEEKTSGASIEKDRKDSPPSSPFSSPSEDSRNREVLTEEELSRNGTIRNRLFGFNFDLNLGGRQSSYTLSMAPYHQAIITAYCRNLLSAISTARIPPTPPVVVNIPVVTVPPTTNSPIRQNIPTGSVSSSNLPPATEGEENLRIQSRTLRCLRSSSLFRSNDPYSMVLNMCTTIVTTGRWN